MTRMCSWPRADLGSGPTRSIPIRSKGTSIIGSGISGVGGGVRGAVRWHTGHAWQNLLTSASSPGQWKRSRIRLVVFLGAQVASHRMGVSQLHDSLRFRSRHHQKFYLLPLAAARHSTASHSGHEVRGGVRRRVGSPSFYLPSLVSSNVLAGRPRVVPCERSPSLKPVGNTSKKG